MRQPILLALLLSLGTTYRLNANELTRYMESYSNTGDSDPGTEKGILLNMPLSSIIKELESYYESPSEKVKRKAFYLTYKKGAEAGTENPAPAINILLDGCSHSGPPVGNTNLGYLQQFGQRHFDDGAKEKIGQLLRDKRYSQNKKLILLAGFVGAGKETLLNAYRDEDTPEQTKYYISHALARMGEAGHIDKCLKTLASLPINNNTVEYALPMAIYTRQKGLIGHCIKILESDEKLCAPPNPDHPGAIPCGYRAVELLAPVINGFPVSADATGINNMGYEEALKTARQWLKDNPGYTLDTDSF